MDLERVIAQVNIGAQPQSGTSTNTFQFSGGENDGTGLYYMRARYYSPALQRFISQYPIGFAGGINLYAYAADNPVSFIDPLGLDPGGGGGKGDLPRNNTGCKTGFNFGVTGGVGGGLGVGIPPLQAAALGEGSAGLRLAEEPLLELMLRQVEVPP